MLKHIPFSSLFKADHGWLQSRFHFLFAEYHDRNNMHYGPLLWIQYIFYWLKWGRANERV